METKIKPYYQQDGVTLYNADCLEAMQALPDNSVDTIITDPPYGLSKEPDITEVLTHWLNGDDYEHNASGGFMGKTWDSFVPGPAVWREALRVLKPGGTALVFGGTRTVDLTTIALRMAGFEIRDVMMYLYGTGFPKSFNIGKGMDKQAECPTCKGRGRIFPYDNMPEESIILFARRNGYGGDSDIHALIHGRMLLEVDCQDCGGTGKGVEREVVGVADRKNGDNGFVGGNATPNITAPATDLAKQWDGWGTALKPAYEPIIVAMKPREGTYVNNAKQWGVAGLWIDGGRVGTEENLVSKHNKTIGGNGIYQGGKPYTTGSTNGRWPANIVHDGSDEVEAGFPETGPSKANKVSDKRKVAFYQAGGDKTGGYSGERNPQNSHNDNGGSASRFFYTAKPSKRERNCDSTVANNHPTVKPLALLQYLARLTKTPTGGVVLDPFMGSGTTGMGCVAEGRRFIGIELDTDYCEIAKRRIEWQVEQEAKPQQPPLIPRN